MINSNYDESEKNAINNLVLMSIYNEIQSTYRHVRQPPIELVKKVFRCSKCESTDNIYNFYKLLNCTLKGDFSEFVRDMDRNVIDSSLNTVDKSDISVEYADKNEYSNTVDYTNNQEDIKFLEMLKESVVEDVKSCDDDIEVMENMKKTDITKKDVKRNKVKSEKDNLLSMNIKETSENKSQDTNDVSENRKFMKRKCAVRELNNNTKCEINNCRFSTSSVFDMRDHHRIIHRTNKKIFINCPYKECVKKYKNINGLKYHINKYH